MNIANLDVRLVHGLGDAAIRAASITVPTALVALLVRRRAATQHVLWTALLVGMLALPVLRPVTPPAHLSLRNPPSVLTDFMNRAVTPQPGRLASVSSDIPASRSHPWQFYLAIVYTLGFCFFTIRLLTGLVITRRLVKRANPIQFASAASLFESSQVRVPLTAGYLFPRIILPLEWRAWDDVTRRAVLAHEGAHVRRRDGLVNLLAAINTCIYWFHPLAWWLERRVAILAEHAADDIAMECCPHPRQYASILLFMAASLNGRMPRILWGGVSMHGGRITERIRRTLSSRSPEPRVTRLTAALIWSVAAVLVWFAGALQLQSTAKAQQSASPIPLPARLTPAQAAELEQQHAADPEDEKTTQRLLLYYRFNHREQEHAQLIFWLIDHHPQSPLLRGTVIGLWPEEDRASYDEARQRWVVQVARHPNDAQVLGNASFTLGVEDQAIAIDYLQRAQTLDPANWTDPLARNYSWALLSNHSDRGFPGAPQLAIQVRQRLQSSTDSALILATVQQLLQSAGQSALGARGPTVDVEQVKMLALEMLGHVDQLQSGSQSVVELKEGVRQLNALPTAMATGASPPAVLRIAANIAAMNLLTSAPPTYPPGAKARGIQGVVKLQIRINDAGRVDSASVISGDPNLTDAAIAGVKQSVYKPTLLNGQPCVVLTTVDVPFRLVQ